MMGSIHEALVGVKRVRLRGRLASHALTLGCLCVASMPATFVREGSVVTSVNYRLAPAVKYDAQAQGAEEGGKARSGADEEVAYRDACERRKRRGDPIILVQL